MASSTLTTRFDAGSLLLAEPLAAQGDLNALTAVVAQAGPSGEPCRERPAPIGCSRPTAAMT
ncbi:hypothetical protein K1T35_48535 (plasmid) [Pseudonocardia sp. DSM 110487]|uniref:hypothetical protein n=1 Tax=Pseudonocardia sp. DSM 110487 TaxID=2865833 RepID=UPI001C69E0DF|nr:hypothetical protein [Pseudonocardia sp. DSM 110487]QYN41196.1 hypothetical protein K1T35_48535 [Pseudonocardia sp. DSM 110487]